MVRKVAKVYSGLYLESVMKQDPEHIFDILTPIEEVVYCMLTGSPYRPHTLDFVAQVFGISKQAVNQIEQKTLAKMKKRIVRVPICDWLEVYVRL